MEVHLLRRWNAPVNLGILSTHTVRNGFSYNEGCVVHSPEIHNWEHRLKRRPCQKLNMVWWVVFCGGFCVLQKNVLMNGEVHTFMWRFGAKSLQWGRTCNICLFRPRLAHWILSFLVSSIYCSLWFHFFYRWELFYNIYAPYFPYLFIIWKTCIVVPMS